MPTRSSRANAGAPFAPPPLEALDRDTKWIDRPGPRRPGRPGRRTGQAAAAATPAEALALKNDSAEPNATILSALGRLPEPRGRPI